MSLCRLHHEAFDRLLLGVHPDRVVHVRRDVLEEVDGPMLMHGLAVRQTHRCVHISKCRKVGSRIG